LVGGIICVREYVGAGKEEILENRHDDGTGNEPAESALWAIGGKKGEA
jgi:hypothetical protein